MSTQPVIPTAYRIPSPISPPPGANVAMRNPPQPLQADWGGSGLIVGDPVHYNPRNPTALPPHVTICSVFPGTLATPFMSFRCIGYPQFVIPAPPTSPTNPLAFSCLRVYDTVAVVSDVNKIENHDWDGADGQTIMPIPALDPSGNGGLAFDIVQKFAGSMIGANPNRQIGIGIIKGDVPTQREVEHLIAIQNALFAWYVNDGDLLSQKGEANKISQLHRFSLEQLGDFDPTRHPWHKEIRRQAMKSCFACGKLIQSTSTVCSECGQDLIALAINRWRALGDPMVTMEMDAVVFPLVEKAIARMAPPQAPAAQAPPAQAPQPPTGEVPKRAKE